MCVPIINFGVFFIIFNAISSKILSTSSPCASLSFNNKIDADERPENNSNSWNVCVCIYDLDEDERDERDDEDRLSDDVDDEKDGIIFVLIIVVCKSWYCSISDEELFGKNNTSKSRAVWMIVSRNINERICSCISLNSKKDEYICECVIYVWFESELIYVDRDL